MVAVLIAIAAVRLVVSGGNSRALDQAKETFINAIIGLLIILSAWLVIDTIMRVLVGNDGRLGTGGDVSGWLFWSEIECQTLYQPTDVGVTTLEFDLPEGAIDQGSGNAGKVTVSTPSGPQVVDIKACDTSNLIAVNFLGSRVTINKQFAASAARIDAAWRARGGNSFYRVTSVGGYNCRNIAGTNRRSNHAYGVAIDINPAANPHTRPGDSNYGQTNMPPAFVQLFLNEGWGWGGNWSSSKDTMHFSKATGEGGNMRGG
jgi:D-alanyl-D-alanine carboxypeptidase/Extensin-like protein C-terminus